MSFKLQAQLIKCVLVGVDEYNSFLLFGGSCNEKMRKLHVASHGAIETEGTGMLQVNTHLRR